MSKGCSDVPTVGSEQIYPIGRQYGQLAEAEPPLIPDQGHEIAGLETSGLPVCSPMPSEHDDTRDV